MSPSNKFTMDQVFWVQKVISNEIQGYSRFKQLIPGSNDKISKFKAYSRSQGPTCQIPGFQGFEVPLGTLILLFLFFYFRAEKICVGWHFFIFLHGDLSI